MKIFYSQSLCGPLLTVETEVNGGFKSTNERGPSLVGSLGLSALVDQVQIFFSSPYTISIPVPISQQAVQAVVLGRLSFSMCLCLFHCRRRIYFLFLCVHS